MRLPPRAGSCKALPCRRGHGQCPRGVGFQRAALELILHGHRRGDAAPAVLPPAHPSEVHGRQRLGGGGGGGLEGAGAACAVSRNVVPGSVLRAGAAMRLRRRQRTRVGLSCLLSRTHESSMSI